MESSVTATQQLSQKIEHMASEIENLNGLIKKLFYAQQKARELEPIEIESEEPAAQVKQSPPLAKPPAGNVAYDDLKGAIATLCATKSRSVALEVLQSFGVNTVKDLDKGSYHDCYLAVKDATL